ncbi:DUF4440 domain-containing protein [Stieleria sp. ICT_E10.1]|uniref:DUF4440 domain-containing protein n=1 Tax=Stieleria sedimenti TaxID=2976331 RepID=UPI00217F428D|nr:DUF4440 domain-containing protein [Stieleria sedimenti]MCS7470002.1 DUF4440 domain-containing protein [Stieleria sedimenti]
MRIAALILLLLHTTSVVGEEMTGAQKEVWSVLVEQVGLDVKQDWDAMKKFIHPKGCFWGDMAPMPADSSEGFYVYYGKLRATEDKILAHHLVPVSVIVVDDVAIVNAYSHALMVDDDEETQEQVYRLHNTWKKHEGKWKLLATYNTLVKSQDDD